MYSRRDLARFAFAAFPSLLSASPGANAAARVAKPDSRWAGVQVGLNVPYSFADSSMAAGDIAAACATLGVSAVELSAQPVEMFLGAPALPAGARPAQPDGVEQGLIPLEEEVLRDSVDLARKTFAAQLARWRSAAPLDRVASLRRRFEEAGVKIEIVQWDGLSELTDDEVDYAFRAAKALGARALSTEMSAAGPRRLASAASRHQLMVGLHGDDATGAADFEAAFRGGAFIGANPDIGDWVAGHQGSPLPFLREHARRITHIHVKDRKVSDGADTPFGDGDVPIRQVLQAMRDNRWPFQATVELEPSISTGSDRMTEAARALSYCRACLLG